MSRYLLDTNILIAVSKNRPGVADRLGLISASQLMLSSVVMAEIEYGIVKSAKPQLNRRVFDALLQGFEVLHFDAAAARHYGALRVALERRGQMIGPNDLMIAAQALSTGAILVTDNVGEFSRVDGLALDNWLA